MGRISTIGLVLVFTILFVGGLIAASPAVLDAVDEDQYTQIAMLWGTVDYFSLSTEVATITYTGTPRPTFTTMPLPSATRVPPTPTFLPDITTLTPTIEEVSSLTPEPSRSRGIHVISTFGLNVRHCPSVNCSKERKGLPYNHYTDVWEDSCGYYGTEYFWCQLNVQGTQQYWVAIRYRDQVWAEWWDGVN